MYQNDGDFSSADQSASDPGTANPNATVPVFKHQTEPQSGDYSQSAPTRDGDYGSTGVPGNMTDANSNFGSSGGAPASGASGFDASAIGGPTPTAGDYTAGDTYGSTGVPGDMSTNTSLPTSGQGQSGGQGQGQGGMVDRMRGGLEQAAGRVTGNPDLTQRGEQRAQGDY